MWRLVPALTTQMGAAFPELIRAQALITETLRFEETNFKQTLERGLRLLDEEDSRLAPGQDFPGEVAFRLYDTYGFPLDLTEDVLRGRSRKVAIAGFDAAMEKQREEARKAGSGPVRRRPVRPGSRCARNWVRPSFSAMRPRTPRASSCAFCAVASR